MSKNYFSFIAAMLALSIPAFSQTADSKAIMAQIKQNLEASMQNLKGYEWLETTTIYKDNEAKSKSQNQCYYDVNNKLVKVPTAASSGGDEKQARGLRGKIVENKKEEMSAFVKQCIAKVHEYLPPNPAKLQTTYASGKTSVQVLEPNKKFRLDFSDYLQAGDKLGVSIDKEKNLLTGINVDTYVEKPENKVNFSIRYALLPDGTQYPEETVMLLPSEGLKVVIRNEGYRKGTAR